MGIAVIPARAEGATRIVLLRHCEAAVAPGVLCGRLDPPLSLRGRAHAIRLAAALRVAPVAAAYASPALRAIETALPIAAEHGVAVDIVPELREVDFGTLEGCTWEQALERDPETCRLWLARPADVVFPGGEGLRDVARRALSALDALAEAHRGEAVLAVAHAGVNRCILASVLGLAARDTFAIEQPHGCVNILDCVAPEEGSLARRWSLALSIDSESKQLVPIASSR